MVVEHAHDDVPFAVAITGQHELPPTSLYEAVVITSGGLTKVLKALTERGLIIQRADAVDWRSKPVRLTKQGAQNIEKPIQHMMASDGALLSKGLEPKEMETITTLLTKLLAELDPAVAHVQ